MKIFKNTLIFFSAFYFMFFAPVFAADVFFESESRELAQDQEFLVNVFLDTKRELINAVEGKISFNGDIVEAQEIRDGNSAINFWIQKPTSSPGEIVFSGITPGGLSGKNLLFSVVFHVRESGSGSMSFSEVRVLKNDGSGGEAQVQALPFDFSISAKANVTPAVLKMADNELPENFQPTVGRDAEIFDGKYFLAFTTQDKISGIDHYEIREGWWGEYTIAQSPYLLKNQSLNKKIYVKAVDKSKNERVVAFRPEGWRWYKQYPLLFGIILAVVLVLFLLKKLWPKSIK
ncbi:MAG: hypothetical protein UT61_C0036G0008 [Candidatus Woesebacteria bacterium GW2011_GWA1_39_8]|uniref:Cohesin domain-containing protein n=1 Tax=Candidatus Woesebacteria bacterium GW2011_GWA1_39_8 TaxID=1618552 RepID=A0A0G0SU93_9BACT|nr:MAG: hypothetical protein UT61_C0036G0008 [Candidatus Woesebacteria bacterium GW2011_GWA1_39_8]